MKTEKNEHIIYRTLPLSFDLPKELIKKFEKWDERTRALCNLWVRGYEVYPSLKECSSTTIEMINRYVVKQKFYKKPKKWFCKIPITCDVLRIINGRRFGNRNAPVVLDLDKKRIKLKNIFPMPLEYPLNDDIIKEIFDRLNSGGDVKVAQVFVKKRKIHVHLVFEKEYKPIEKTETKLIIDINSWKYGIKWWVIWNRKVILYGIIKPDLEYLERLYNEVVHLERKYGKLKRLKLHKSEYGKRLWKQIKAKRSRIYRYLKDFVNKKVNELIKIAIIFKSEIWGDYMKEESRRELLEEKLPNGLIKLYLLYLPRFVKLLENQTKWYGLPFKLERLPSTICPICESEMIHIGNRVMKCLNCGFEENRDEIPLYWALKKLNKLPLSLIHI